MKNSSEIQKLHHIIENSVNKTLLTQRFPQFNNGGIIHYLVEQLKSPEALAYALCRGHEVVISGINCKDLPPVDLSIQNSEGKTALDLAQELLLKSDNETDTRKMQYMIRFLKLANIGDFERISNEVDFSEAKSKTKQNALLTQPRETDIAKSQTPVKVKFESMAEITEHSKPHYPAFDKAWKHQDTAENRYKFIAAYQNNDFPAMQRAIIDYKIKFKASDTLSELAYEAVNHNCLPMSKYLVKEGSADREYIPAGESLNLVEKFNKANAERKALQALDPQVVREKRLAEGRIDTPPFKKITSPHR